MSIHSDLSQASTILNNNESPVPSPTKEISTRKKIKHAIAKTNAQDVLLFLLAFRILNALCVDTFFQPDEFFQSLEPAWRIAFGSGGGKASGAWLTWVRRAVANCTQPVADMSDRNGATTCVLRSIQVYLRQHIGLLIDSRVLCNSHPHLTLIFSWRHQKLCKRCSRRCKTSTHGNWHEVYLDTEAMNRGLHWL